MAKKKRLLIDDFLGFRYPSEVTYNPAGTVLAFQCAQADTVKNDYDRDIWLARGGHVSRLTHSADSRLAGWQDDSHVLLVRPDKQAAAQGRSVLSRIDIDGGEAEPFLSLPFVMEEVRKADARTYVISGAIDVGHPDIYKATPKVRQRYLDQLKKDADYRVLDELPYYMNGAGYLNKKRTALFAVTTRPFKVERITAPQAGVTDFIIDGGRVIYACTDYDRVQPMQHDVYAYDLAKGRTTLLYGKRQYMIGKLLAIGGTVYALATDNKQYGLNETPKFYALSKGELVLAADNQDTLGDSICTDCLLDGGHAMAVDGMDLFSIATIADHSQLRRYGAGFKYKVIFEQPGLVSCLDAKGGRLAMVAMLDNGLAEVYEADSDGAHLRRLTRFNDKALKDRYVAACHPLEYRSCGWGLKGWVLLPEGFSASRSYPAILDIHGGPRAAYGEVFFNEMQVWASRGYVVMFTNPFGADGRGDRFADIRGHYGNEDFKNLMAFVDAVLKSYPNIDAKRLGVTGGSYGGFMTNWIIGHTDRFAAAASQRSIANWLGFCFTSDIGPWFDIDQVAADPLVDPAKVWAQSPLASAAKAVTPTLFIHSDEDYRCPLSEGMQMMQALTFHGVATRMVVFKGENHELSRSGKPLHRQRRLQEITDWFDRYLMEPAPRRGRRG